MDCLMDLVLRDGETCAKDKEWNCHFFEEHDESPLFLLGEEDAFGAVLFLPGG
jgi:hypothetical protein